MKKILLSLLSCLCLLTAWADGPFREHRYDAFKVAPVNENSIVFIGNSITNMHDWHSAFANHNMANRGVSGGYATEILANLESYIAGKPAQVFLMIGTNDMAPNGLSHSPEQIATNIRKIVERIEKVSPNTKVRLTSIFPSTSTGRSLEKIQAANTLIKALAEEKGLVYIDLYEDLQGILNNTHSRDGLHLSMSGYRIWCNKVKELVGSDCVYPADATNQYASLAAAYDMRVSCWGATPIKASDVLFIGDEMINGGEWHEMLSCPNVKNYGQAWGYAGAPLDNTLAMLPILFKGREDNVAPKQVFLYTGVADVNGSADLQTVQDKYSNVVNKIKQLAPTTTIHLMSLQPTSNATNNSGRVKPFNSWLKSLAESDDKLEYVDIYTDFENAAGVGDSKYFVGNYLWGLGYAKVAKILEPLIEGASAMTEAEAEARINMLNARNALGTAISNLSDIPLGDGVGEYPESLKATIDEVIANGYALLCKEDATTAELQAFGENITASVGSLQASINMPKASTAGNEHWYQITSLRDASRLVTAGGTAAGVQGTAEEAKYASSMWKFVERTDGTYDIVNREYGSYLSPTAAQNSQVQTTEAQPAGGWTLSYGSTQSYYIIYSGTVQLNQTGSPQNYQIYNWGHTDGTYNRDDTGCQLWIQDAPQPEERPADPNALPEALLSLSDISLEGTAPHKIDDALAAAALAAGSVTVAVDYTLSSSADGEQCLFGSSNSEAAASFSCLNVNPGSGKMIARFDTGGGKYTMNAVAGANRTQVILTMSTAGYKLFVNGSNTATINHSSARDLGSYTGADGLYLGGLVTSGDDNLYPASGTIHSIRIFPGVLTDTQIARIQFGDSGTEPDVDPDKMETLTYTIDKANGNLYHANGNANQNWNCSWKSNATPQLTFGCGSINNMNWAGDNIQLMSGSAGSATYSITAPSGCLIEEYSFTFVNNNHDTGIELTMNDTEHKYTSSPEEQTVSQTGLEVDHVSFLFKGTNGKGVILKDFIVKVKGVPVDAKVTSTLVEQGKVTTGIGNKDDGIIRSTITVSGSGGACKLQSIEAHYTGKDVLDVDKAKIYMATNDRELYVDKQNLMPWREQNGTLLGETTLEGNRRFTIPLDHALPPGKHYLWIAFDVAETAKEGNTVDARILNYVVDGDTITETIKTGHPANAATIFLSESAVLLPWDMGTQYYRIPSITVTKDGKRLVTITDDRANFNSDLPAHCKLMAQYSDDQGKSWSQPQLVAGSAELGGNYGHGDASIVTNRDNGDIIGIMTSSPHGYGFFNGGARQRPAWKTIVSHDNGETWEAPVDHTDDLYGAYCDDPVRKTWQSGFSGSGAALQRRDGTLISSFVNRLADGNKHFYFFMSKDGGQNWYVSGTSGTSDADEPKTLERNNGDLAISVRHGGYNYHNVTSDEGETWHYKAKTPFTSGIYGNACDGEYMVWCSTLEGNPWNIALQTGPNHKDRQNVSIALSTDEGSTFGNPKTICPRGSAYSATTVLPDGTLGIYYEENGLDSKGYTMRYVRCSLDWASSGEYKFTEENPFRPIKSTATGINDVLQGSDANADVTTYDLQGRKIETPTVGGIYIQNGKKVFVK